MDSELGALIALFNSQTPVVRRRRKTLLRRDTAFLDGPPSHHCQIRSESGKTAEDVRSSAPLCCRCRMEEDWQPTISGRNTADEGTRRWFDGIDASPTKPFTRKSLRTPERSCVANSTDNKQLPHLWSDPIRSWHSSENTELTGLRGHAITATTVANKGDRYWPEIVHAPPC